MSRTLLGIAAAFALVLLLIGILSNPNGAMMDLEPSAGNPEGPWFREEVLNSQIPVLVDFGAEWCGPCRIIAPTLDQLETEYADKIKVVRIDIDKSSALAEDFNVTGIPLLLVVKEGKVVARMAGASPGFNYQDLVTFVEPHL